jgi:hypothetical protein
VSNGDLIALAGVFVAFVALIVAFVAMIWQAKQTHATNSVDNMWRFLDEWDSQQMHQIRVKACQSLKVKGNSNDISDLLNFFEELGFLVRQGSLDAYAAWAMFFDWACPYWTAADYYIAADQGNDFTYWEDFQYLNTALLNIESKRRHRSVDQVKPTHGDVEKLIEGELTLGSEDAKAVALAPGASAAPIRTFSPMRRKRPKTEPS